MERAALFEAARRARVGGRFWGEPASLAQPPRIVVRADNAPEPTREGDAEPASWIGRDDTDPWSVLPGAGRLVAHGDDEWVAIARIAGVPVRVVSSGAFGSPEDDDTDLDARAAAALCRPLRDPFGDGWLAPLDAIALLAEWRTVIDANRGAPGEAIVAVLGMAWWKKAEIRRFLWVPGISLAFVSDARRALDIARDKGGALAVWPSRVSPALIAEAKQRGVPLVRVEDGFVRSVGLGSDLVPPASIVVDRHGIHFDPREPSDLEAILAQTRFAPDLLTRARRLAESIVAGGISKYSAGTGATGDLPDRADGVRRVLVPGQVEDDMSVLAGGGGLTSNLELLRRVRELEPDAEIWWRPHPDVDAGHRNGAVADEAALEYADRIVRGGSIAHLLDRVDGLHVLTSLTGFEALLRGRDVTCHGTPFYAGWGLTRDLGTVPEGRGRKLSLDELVAGVLILYPRYLDPVSGLPCPPEVLVRRMAENRMVNRQGWIGPVRRFQGRVMARLRRRGAVR
ncbi:beta-3-deoxy-D-manno-oct-2-ulosonic acid transferase [Pelagerythrobacter sp.]|uniref:capsular polysaccharide export protein, LipB/KpsS family n=1 Tax=Pelagerythrobacter sp. TaxID=2800702 RepID=UPI0035B15663